MSTGGPLSGRGSNDRRLQSPAATPLPTRRRSHGPLPGVDAYECKLVGIQHEGGHLNWPPGDYDVHPSALAHPWFAGTGFPANSVLDGLVSAETDTIPPWDNGASCGHTLTSFFHHDGGGDELGNADATAYTRPAAPSSSRPARSSSSGGSPTRPRSSAGPRAGRPASPTLRAPTCSTTSRRGTSPTSGVALTAASTRGPWATRFKVLVRITNAGPNPASLITLDVTLPAGSPSSGSRQPW